MRSYSKHLDLLDDLQRALHALTRAAEQPPQQRRSVSSIGRVNRQHWALRDRLNEDATARAIAAQLHGGQASPLYALASSGAHVDDLQDELDAIFSETPDEEVGEVSELGRYALIKHEGKPGGLILRQDQDGWRHVREALMDEALEAEWSALRQDYESYYEERDAFELATSEADDAPSGVNPHIWVGSLADYNAGRLYGEWMDATLEPDELHAADRFLLRHSTEPGAEEWAIFDYENFGGYRVEEYSSFDTNSLIAKGLAEHGPAYAEWVDLVGDTSGELLEPERFQDAYLGEYDSLEDYVEYVLEETELYDQLDRALGSYPKTCGGSSR